MNIIMNKKFEVKDENYNIVTIYADTFVLSEDYLYFYKESKDGKAISTLAIFRPNAWKYMREVVE